MKNSTDKLSTRWFRYGIRTVEKIDQLLYLLNHRAESLIVGLWAKPTLEFGI